jgi:hypothetical protein
MQACLPCNWFLEGDIFAVVEASTLIRLSSSLLLLLLLLSVPPTTPTQERASSRQSFNDQQRSGSQRPTSASRQSPGNTGRPTSQTSPRHQSHVQFRPSPSQGQGQRQSAVGGSSYKPAANSSNNNRSVDGCFNCVQCTVLTQYAMSVDL